MGFFRSREDSLKFWLSFFFITGSIGGSIFCNGCSDRIRTELLQIGQRAITEASLAGVDYQRLLVKVLWKRGKNFLIILFMLAAPAEKRMRMVLAVYGGFSVAVMIGPLTMHAGMWGLWNYLCMNLPHGCLYLLVGYFLLWWMPLNGKQISMGPICILGLIMCIGTVLETYINPYFLTYLFKI